MSVPFADLREQGSKNKNPPSKEKKSLTEEEEKESSPVVVSGVPLENYWEGLLKTPKTIFTPAGKLENNKDVYSPDKLPATVNEIPTEGDTPNDGNDGNDGNNDDGFTMVVKLSRNVNTSRYGQAHRRPKVRVPKPRVRKPVAEKVKLPPPKPIKASHVAPKKVIQPHGESPLEQKREILLFPVPQMPDRSDFKLDVDGVWNDTTPVKEEEPELPVASVEHVFTMCFKLLTWMLVGLVPVDQEIDDLSTFSCEIVTLYTRACEQDDHENELKLERLKVCLEMIQVYSDFLLHSRWMSHKTSPPKDREEAFQHLAVWFYEIISIYQDMSDAYDGGDLDVVRTGHEKQAPDLAVKNLLGGGFFTLLPHFLGNENRHLRSVFDDQNLELELLSEKRIAARILLQFVLWILPQANRGENAIRLSKFVRKVMSWDDETDSLTQFMGQVFSE